MDLVASADGWVSWHGGRVRCALGHGGVTTDKREGDGATPLGCHPLRRVFYRADRLAPPLTSLEMRRLEPFDGWCDDPGHADYNRLIRLPHPARHEALWRGEGVYDLIIPLGWNDDPVVPGRGSAIFLHVAKPGYLPTEGCVALALADLLIVLRDCDPSTRLCVQGEASRP